MKLEKLEVFSDDEVKMIHNSTLELLAKVGIKIDCMETQELLTEYGAEVDKGNFVKFPEELIIEELKKVPNSFKLYGPDGSFNFEVNTKTTQFATIGTPVKIYDPSNKKGVRKTVLNDTIKQIKIVDSLEHINCII
jgi:trimethylamine--corrinoid protein Co-methyltransferase